MGMKVYLMCCLFTAYCMGLFLPERALGIEPYTRNNNNSIQKTQAFYNKSSSLLSSNLNLSIFSSNLNLSKSSPYPYHAIITADSVHIKDEIYNNDVGITSDNAVIDIQNSTVNGAITVSGDTTVSSSIATFFASNTEIRDGIVISSYTINFTYGEKLLLRDSVILMGEEIQFTADNTTITAVSIITSNTTGNTTLDISSTAIDGTSFSISGITNTLLLKDTVMNDAMIVLDGVNNSLTIGGASKFNGTSMIDISGDSQTYISSALPTLSFLEYDMFSKHSLTLQEGFIYSGAELQIPLPSTAGNTLSLDGSHITGNIVIEKGVTLQVHWQNNTYFNGTIYTNTAGIREAVGWGFVDVVVEKVDIPTLVSGSILGLQKGVVWKGDIAGSNASIGIMESTVLGNITSANSSIFIRNSTINNITAGTSDVLVKDILVEGSDIDTNTLTVNGTVTFTSEHPMYTLSSTTIYSNVNAGGVIFSTVNGNATNVLQVNSTAGVSKYTAGSILFKGDVDFTSLTGDTFIWNVTGDAIQYTVDIQPTTLGYYEGLRRVENILQGFETTPVLYRNTYGGYDIFLEANSTMPDSYDIVLAGYSASNYVFAGFGTVETFHAEAYTSLINQRMLYSLSVLNTVQRTLPYMWLTQNIQGITMQGENSSALKGFLGSTALGFSSHVASYGKIALQANAFIQYAYSHSTENSGANSRIANNTINGNSVHVGAMLTKSLLLNPNNSIALTTHIGGTYFTGEIGREDSRTFDTIKQYGFTTGLYASYSSKVGSMRYIPYISMAYTYGSSYNFISDDSTEVSFAGKHTITPALGFSMEYVHKNYKPYIDMSLSRAFIMQGEEVIVAGMALPYGMREHMKGTALLGFEYNGFIFRKKYSVGIEAGVDAFFANKNTIAPVGNAYIAISL